MFVLFLIYRRQRNRHQNGEQSNRVLIAALQSLMFALHGLPLVAYVRHMNTQCDTITGTFHESIAFPTSIKSKGNYPTPSDVFKRWRSFVFCRKYKLLFVASSSITWTGLLLDFCIFCAAKFCVWGIMLLTGKCIHQLLILFSSNNQKYWKPTWS